MNKTQLSQQYINKKTSGLSITRQEGETFLIYPGKGNECLNAQQLFTNPVSITLTSISNYNGVRLNIDADKRLSIVRKELWEKTKGHFHRGQHSNQNTYNANFIRVAHETLDKRTLEKILNKVALM